MIELGKGPRDDFDLWEAECSDIPVKQIVVVTKRAINVLHRMDGKQVTEVWYKDINDDLRHCVEVVWFLKLGYWPR